MAYIASSSSSSKATIPKYEVFLSFRGEDTRYTFVSHLYAALSRRTKTYIDEKSLQRGHEISYSLTQAIMESRVYVVVFSENYASSSWCLDELVHILQCKERHGQIVVPVFYRVKPADIRKQQGSFGEAFSVVKERFKDRVEQVNKWTVALSAAANLSGWDSSVIRDEAELVERIVEDVITKLNSMPGLSDYGWAQALVGIEKQAKEIEKLLSVGTSGIHIIGIWGMGGIGKTTLATVVFKRLSSQFRGCCFLENVREKWTKGREEDLQKELFYGLLKEENPYNAKERLRNTKVLVVLDDINDQRQLHYLIGDGRTSFGDGSRIIVTTRDKQMLRFIKADATFEVEVLNDDEALELFLLNAFGGNLPTSNTGNIKISERVVNYAKGVPLALKVLGSFLRCKAEENWESELNELEQAPDENIQKVLKVSYDQLKKKDQQIFLDIACFFDWADRDWAEDFWTACGFDPKKGVDNLIEKSLLIIRDSNTLWMHDLIKEMGREIVSSIEELGKRCRLWKAEDVIYVLKNNLGTGAIEGIILEASLIADVHLGPAVFEGMHNLRFLRVKLYHSNGRLVFSKGLHSLPTELRYLEWNWYPLKSLPSEFSPHNLVEIRMPYSKLKKLWDGIQDLGNLKLIDLRSSDRLTQIPDLSRAPKLEILIVRYCESLARVPNLSFSTQTLDLSRRFHHRFAQFRTYNSEKPGTLDLFGCIHLQLVGNISGNLQHLDLGQSAVEELPSSIWSLHNLISLNLNCCFLIKNIPSSIRNLTSLKHLSLRACCSLTKFPVNIPTSIVELDLSGTKINDVPSSIKRVTCLKEFHLNDCTSLVNLSTSICELKYLRSLNLCGCSSLEKFPEILKPMDRLRTLELNRTGITEITVSFEKLIGLHSLQLDKCCIPSLPARIGCLSLLQILSLEETLIAEVPPSIKDISGLIELNVSYCKNLQALPELPSSLAILVATGCTSLETVSNSKNVLIAGHWAAYQVTPYKQFFFHNCSNLDPIARDNIMIDSQIRILRTAAISVSQPEEISRVFDEKPFVSVCWPGNEIPSWFSSQSKIPLINIKLSPNWHNNFIGFALCAVVECCADCLVKPEGKYYFKTSKGKSPEFHYQFWEPRQIDPHWQHADFRCFDRVLMWYNFKDYHDYTDAVEMSFEFTTILKNAFDGEKHWIRLHSGRIRMCGVRLLYLQDAEEFDIVFKAKPHGDATVDSDTYGPHTKRPRFSNL